MKTIFKTVAILAALIGLVSCGGFDEKVNEQIVAEQANFETVSKSLEGLAAQFDTERKTWMTAKEALPADTTFNYASLEGASAKVAESAQTLATKAADLTKQISELPTSYKEGKVKTEDVLKQIETLKTDLASVSEEKAKVEAEYTRIKDEFSKLLASHTAKKEEAEKALAEAAAKKGKKK
jgi:uncharacterized protein (DUF3084 family)